jgi:hypothetical protein
MMSFDLAHVLKKETPIRVIRTYVAAVDTTNRTATVRYTDESIAANPDNIDIPGVAYTGNYTPVVGDFAETLVMETRGMLLLGKVTFATTPAAAVITPTSTTVSSYAGYNERSGEWNSSTQLPVGGVQNVAMFYPASFGTGLVGKTLTGLTIKIQPFQVFEKISLAVDLLKAGTGTGSPGSYTSMSRVFTPYIPTGVLTTVYLPIAWAQAFRDATAVGIGLHSDLYETVIQTTVTNQGQLTASYTN